MAEDPRKKKRERIWEPAWRHRIEIFASILLIAGLVLSFYYFRLGGALVGMGFGVCFYEEMHNYFIQLRDLFIDQSVFKTVVLVGTIIFFLIAIPIFIVASAIGYGAMYLVNLIAKR
jgi:hypothetical protein